MKFTLFFVLSLFGIPIYSMTLPAKLIDNAIKSLPGEHEAFEELTNYLRTHDIDCDSVKIERDWVSPTHVEHRTVIDYIEECRLLQKMKGLLTEAVEKRFLAVFEVVMPYRSLPPDVYTFRSLVEKGLDTSYFKDLKDFLKKDCHYNGKPLAKRYNIDLIILNDYTHGSKTIGELLDDLVSKRDALSDRALAIIQLDEIKKFRTKQPSPVEKLWELVSEVLEGRSQFNELKSHVEHLHKNGTKIDCDESFKYRGLDVKIADAIESHLKSSTSADRQRALMVAELFQEARVGKFLVYHTLFTVYADDTSHDPSIFEDLTAWFIQHPFDTDKKQYGAKTVTETVQNRFSHQDDKDKLRAFEQLTRPYRASEMEALRVLLKRYELDKTTQAEFKKWLDEHLFDATRLGSSFGSKDLEAIKEVRLNNAPKPVDPVQSKTHLQQQAQKLSSSRTWLSRKNIVLAIGFLGGAFYILHKRIPFDRNDSKDSDSIKAL